MKYKISEENDQVRLRVAPNGPRSPKFNGFNVQDQDMNLLCRDAFKEWAVICSALGMGKQSLILRKGGIHEGRDGFRVAHNEFWLFPTAFHQNSGVLAPGAESIIEQVRAEQPTTDQIRIRHYVVVERVVEILDASRLPPLAPLHIWSSQTIQDKFDYRAPGIFALLVRVYELPNSVTIPNSPHFAGCRTWVELSEAVPTIGARPVVSDDVHQSRMNQLGQLL
jgi:hypothetical protein